MKFKVMFTFLLQQMYSDRRGNICTKTTPNKTFQTKDPLTKPPGHKPHEQLRENLYRGLLFGVFVLGLLTIAVVPEMCDVLWEVPGCVSKCDRGGQNWPKIA